MIKLFEMFSGYGGASFALKKAGILFEIVGFSEIKKFAIETYKINHGDIKNFGDCTKINPNDIPDFDLLTGGFPCQDVSVVGKNDLTCGRTLLINDIFRIAKEKHPNFIILENVKGLTSLRHKEFFDNIIATLKELNYNVYYKVLNSLDFNTPQNRERIYFVCIKKDLKQSFEFPEKEPYINDWHNYIDDEKNFIKVNKTKSRIIMQNKCKNITNKKHCQTISLKQDRYPNAGIINYEDFYRFLTPRECFRLQGFFNDEIKIDHLSIHQSYNLAGDGWDINIVSKIFKKLFLYDTKILTDELK